jgi:hypothetical protein
MSQEAVVEGVEDEKDGRFHTGLKILPQPAGVKIQGFTVGTYSVRLPGKGDLQRPQGQGKEAEPGVQSAFYVFCDLVFGFKHLFWTVFLSFGLKTQF